MAGGNPFDWFGTILALNLDDATERWNESLERFEALGIDETVRRFSAVPTPENHHAGCAISWRGMIELAQAEGRPRFLGLEDDAVFHARTLELLPPMTELLETMDWDLFYLGCVTRATEPSEGILQPLVDPTTTHAVAINSTAYRRLLEDLPTGEEVGLERFLSRYLAVDQYLAALVRRGELRAYAAIPHLASQPALLNYADADLAIAENFIL